MATTIYKGYEEQTTGSNSGLWGTVLNEDCLEVIDRNVGGIVAKSVTSSNVTLSAEESQYLILRLSGTLTGDRLVTTACTGMTIVENLCTGSFAVTFGNGVGTPVEVAQGARTLVITDSTNSPRPGVDAFPTGTRLAFQQETPPVGWSKDLFASYNNATIRLTSGAASYGGSANFTSVFTSRTPAGTVGNTTLTTSQIPSHQHLSFNTDFPGTTGSGLNSGTYPTYGAGGAGSAAYAMSGSSTVASIGLTSATGSSGSHTHSFTGTAMDFAVKYVDFCIGIKD